MVKRRSQTPPLKDYEIIEIPVGSLNNTFENEQGPQRNRPQDYVGNRWRAALRGRAKAYGDFSWPLLRPCVVSKRGEGRYYPLDGNSSNHWLAEIFGPDFMRPCYVLTGLTSTKEMELFLRLQVVKKVTPTEAYRVRVEYDTTSQEHVIAKTLSDFGFVTTSANIPTGIGITASRLVLSRHGEERLRQTLQFIVDTFPDTDAARTNGSLFKAIALALGNPEYDPILLGHILRKVGAKPLAEGARGAGAENIVIERIRESYKNQGLSLSMSGEGWKVYSTPPYSATYLG